MRRRHPRPRTEARLRCSSRSPSWRWHSRVTTRAQAPSRPEPQGLGSSWTGSLGACTRAVAAPLKRGDRILEVTHTLLAKPWGRGDRQAGAPSPGTEIHREGRVSEHCLHLLCALCPSAGAWFLWWTRAGLRVTQATHPSVPTGIPGVLVSPVGHMTIPADAAAELERLQLRVDAVLKAGKYDKRLCLGGVGGLPFAGGAPPPPPSTTSRWSSAALPVFLANVTNNRFRVHLVFTEAS